MKRIVWIIIISLTVTCCLPILSDYSCGEESVQEQLKCDVPEDNDDILQKSEHIFINYARKEKRVKIEKYLRVIERTSAEKAITFCITEFNDTGLFTEAIKRDYSGDDPLHIA